MATPSTTTILGNRRHRTTLFTNDNDLGHKTRKNSLRTVSASIFKGKMRQSPCMEAANNSPLITIGVTCFNAEDTITRAIKSAQNQTYPNFEIVVVDDASTDKSMKVVEKIKEQDQRIFLHRHHENQGVAAARNTIIEKAKGEYIAFFDDDDESIPERLSKQYQRLSQFEQKHPDKPVLCYCHRTHIKPSEQKRVFMVSGCRPPEPHGEMVVDFLLYNKKQRGYSLTGDFGSGVMMASYTLLQRFKFDPQFRRTEDWDIAIRIALEEGYFISIGESLVNQYATEASNKGGGTGLKYRLMILKKYKNYLQQRQMYWTAFFYMHARFYFDVEKNKPMRYLFLFLASVLSPKKIFFDNIANKLSKRL